MRVRVRVTVTVPVTVPVRVRVLEPLPKGRKSAAYQASLHTKT